MDRKNVILNEATNSVTISAEDLAGNIGEATRTFVGLPVSGETDPVLDWNHQALESIRLDAKSPPEASRALAIMHSAILDAVNALDGTPGRYISLPAQPSASAAATAPARPS